MGEQSEQDLREALKRVAVALKESGMPYALSGGYAAWARGAPEPSHDVDFVVAEQDAERVAEYLRGAGLRVERPAEDWLLKVYTDGAMVDVLFRANGVPVRQEDLAALAEVDVISVWMPVLPATDLLVQKLKALDERYCDFATVLPTARALREQVDWAQVTHRVRGNDFAEVLLELLVRLRVVDRAQLAADT
jgi:hypothetical protein